MKNKKGWIRIVEAFVAILLITGVLLVVINKGYIGNNNLSERIYDFQLSVLREIETDSNLRSVILDPNLIIPVEEGEGSFPRDILNVIISEKPNYLECKSKICLAERICSLETYNVEKDVYANSVIITANLTEYNPRQIKIFCWTKDQLPI